MSQKTSQIIAVFAIIILGLGGLFITIGLVNLDNTGTITTTDTITTTTTDTTTTTTTNETTTETTTTTDTTTTTTTTTEEPTTLTILTRHDIAVQGVFESAFLSSSFAIENDIIDIKWRSPADQFWDDLIDDGIIDVCWGGGPLLFDQLLAGGRLSPLDSILMQEVESRVNDTVAGADMKRNNTADELCWIASKLSSFGFTINHAFLDAYSLPVPTSWANLSNPIYGSLLPLIPTIAMADAGSSTSHKYIYDLIVQIMGWEAGWVQLSRMAGSAEIKGGSVESQAAVENGDVGIGISLDFYGFLSQHTNPDCEYIVPADGTSISGDPIAIPVSVVNKSKSEGFVDFVLSPYGQSLWLDENLLRLPIMREAFDEPGAIGMEYMYSIFNQTCRSTSAAVNETQSMAMDTSFLSYFGSVLTYSHDELSSCWSDMVALYYAGNITETELDTYASQMGDLVSIVDPITSVLERFTLDYAIRINNDMFYDASYRSAVQSRWTAAAQIQYLNVQSSLPSSFASTYDPKLRLLSSLQALITLFLGSSGLAAIVLTVPKYG